MAEYRIRDIETLTGIRAHTLRTWEKRYGLPSPGRTQTQIRTYNDDELQLLLNIALLNRNGIKISHIAEMTIQEITQRTASLVLNKTLHVAIEQLTLALIRMDEVLFRSVLQELIAEYGIEQTFQQYIIPFLDRIGVLWLVGSISPAQEHFISNLVRQRISAEIEQLPAPDPNRPKTILFLPEHEWHELGLLLYHYHLRRKGIPTVYLGQALPYSSLLKAIEAVQPKWLVTSWLTAVEQTTIEDYFRQLASDAPHVLVVASGAQVLQYDASIRMYVHGFHSLEALSAVFN